MAALRQALVEHKVLFFTGQDLTDDEQVDFGRRLGELTAAHPVAAPLDDSHPEVYPIDRADPDSSFSDGWHTDVTFMPHPPLGCILRAVELPPTGGDTSWADSQLAYESLSDPVQRLVDQLDAVHDGNREWGHHLKHGRGGRGDEWQGETVTELTPVVHPVVRVHPETGREGLFVKPGIHLPHPARLRGGEPEHPRPALHTHLSKPEHTIRHRWHTGDLGRDYVAQRVMRRITLAGDRPVGPPRVP